MQVVIHAGVPYTDAGQLLANLAAHKGALYKAGTLPLGPRRCRQFVKVMSDAMASGLPLAEAREQMNAVLPDAADIQRVVVSSEKFFGPMRAALQHGQIYPFAGKRAAYTQDLLNGAQIEIFAGLMNPGLFIPRVLTALDPARTRSILDTTDLSCLSWVTMIEDLGDLVPDVKITLWENEDSPLIWGDILRAMAGLPDSIAIPGEHTLLASLLTEQGKHQLLPLIQQEQSGARLASGAELARLLEAHAQPDRVEEELDLPGWSTEIVSAFSELYAQDMAKIRTMPNVRVLEV